MLATKDNAGNKAHTIVAGEDTSEHVLFDGDDIKVMTRTGSGDVLFITWQTKPGPGKDNEPFGQGLIEKNDFSAVYILAKASHWWQTPETAKVEQIIRKYLKGKSFSHRFAYGASMGGFGVLLSAAKVGCDIALVAAPQISVDPAVVPFETRWRRDIERIKFQESDARVGIKSSCRYYILYDPVDRLDSRHVSMIADTPNVEKIAFPFAGHKILKLLKETRILHNAVSSASLGTLDVKALKKTVRAGRRQSPHYFETMYDMAAERGRAHLALTASRYWWQLQPGSTTAYNAISKGLLAEGLYDELLRVTHSHLAETNNSLVPYRNERYALNSLRRYQETFTSARAICDRPDSSADDFRWLVRGCFRQKLFDAAIAAAEEAIARFGESPSLLRLKFETLVEADRLDDAVPLAPRLDAIGDEKDAALLQRFRDKVAARKTDG